MDEKHEAVMPIDVAQGYANAVVSKLVPQFDQRSSKP